MYCGSSLPRNESNVKPPETPAERKGLLVRWWERFHSSTPFFVWHRRQQTEAQSLESGRRYAACLPALKAAREHYRVGDDSERVSVLIRAEVQPYRAGFERLRKDNERLAAEIARLRRDVDQVPHAIAAAIEIAANEGGCP
jgi:hypothetical protein